jgi:alanyl-tRNA synthetase
MTERLFWDDPNLLAFDAVVIAHGEHGGRPSVVLDRTAFYAESGGQLADRGALAGASVIDVQVAADGRIHHLFEGERPSVGASVHGTVDRARRRQHRADHTGQHVLSHALFRTLGARTVASRLGDTGNTIDTDRPVSDADAFAAEDLANEIADEDLPVRAWFPDERERTALGVVARDDLGQPLRLVKIGDLDTQKCGGTHCDRTGQIGLVFVHSVVSHKGGSRVRFFCGPRGRRAMNEEARRIRAIAKDLSSGTDGIAAQIDKLRSERTEARELAGRLGSEWAAVQAERFGHRNETAIVGVFDVPAEAVRHLGAALTKDGERVAILAARTGDEAHVLAVRGPSSSFDCGAFIKRAAAAAGGKGGGRPERAEGRFPALAELESVLRSAIASG